MPCMGVPGRLGRYAVRRRLGSGGFATVWLAYDEQLDAEVAVKVLSDTWIDDEAVRRRFLEEGRFLRRVESEYVVQVHDVGELDDGRPFLVLTYADSGTLQDRIRTEPLGLDATVEVVCQIGRGLQALHRRGLLHRDVKPANVLFRSTDDGERAVLSDLGLGKSLDEVSRSTITGGTPSYVAPEQALGNHLDARADQYSLGAVAYAALTGRSPHQVTGLGAAGPAELPPRPSELGAPVPGRIDEAILRALQPDPEDRWPDVAAFTADLVAALAEGGSGGNTGGNSRGGAGSGVGVGAGGVGSKASGAADQPTVAGRPRRRRTRWVVAALVALVAGAGCGFAGQRFVADRQLVQVGDAAIVVRVPRAWAQNVDGSSWQPPWGGGVQPALRASAYGTPNSEGVFVGVLPGTRLPSALPAHDECRQSGSLDASQIDGRPAATRAYSACTGPRYTFERLVQAAPDKLVWVLIRAADEKLLDEVAQSVVYDGRTVS